jgi:hypothetical protein
MKTDGDIVLVPQQVLVALSDERDGYKAALKRISKLHQGARTKTCATIATEVLKRFHP